MLCSRVTKAGLAKVKRNVLKRRHLNIRKNGFEENWACFRSRVKNLGKWPLNCFLLKILEFMRNKIISTMYQKLRKMSCNCPK